MGIGWTPRKTERDQAFPLYRVHRDVILKAPALPFFFSSGRPIKPVLFMRFIFHPPYPPYKTPDNRAPVCLMSRRHQFAPARVPLSCVPAVTRECDWEGELFIFDAKELN